MRKHKLTLKTTIFFLFFHFGSKALMLYVNHKSYFFVRKIVANKVIKHIFYATIQYFLKILIYYNKCIYLCIELK